MARFLADENFNNHSKLKWWAGGFAMPKTAQEIYSQVVSVLSLDERLRLATLILNDLIQQNVSVIERSDT